MLKFLLEPFERPKIKVRQKAADKRCPFCFLGTPIIYDQKHDCCTSCNSKWAITK